MTQIWRRANEEVHIGDDITVTVLSVGLSYVRLGISCPNHDPSYREVELAKCCDSGDDVGELAEDVESLTGKRLRF